MKKLKFKRYYSLELARNRTACQSGGKIHTSVWPLKLIPSSYPRLSFHSLFHSEILSLVNFRAAIYMGQIIQHLRTISLNMNWRDPGILHSRNFVVIDEQCGAGSAKPWLDWMSQPEAVPRKPAILQWLPPYGGPPLSQLWECGGRSGLALQQQTGWTKAWDGHRCPSNCTEPISCHSTQCHVLFNSECILEIQFAGYTTHIVNWCVLSQFICWRTGVHITRTNSPIDGNWCLGCQSEPRGQGLKVHENELIIISTCGPVCFTGGSQRTF